MTTSLASIERIFSTFGIIMSKLPNRLGYNKPHFFLQNIKRCYDVCLFINFYLVYFIIKLLINTNTLLFLIYLFIFI